MWHFIANNNIEKEKKSMKNIKVFIFAIIFALVLSRITVQILAVDIELRVLFSLGYVFIGSMIGKKLFKEIGKT